MSKKHPLTENKAEKNNGENPVRNVNISKRFPKKIKKKKKRI